jgi:hypothetical protein
MFGDPRRGPGLRRTGFAGNWSDCDSEGSLLAGTCSARPAFDRLGYFFEVSRRHQIVP